jgi:hypothetical protein
MTCLKTPEQAAEFLQCSPKHVHAHAKSGELRYVDIGRGSSVHVADSLTQTLLILPNADRGEKRRHVSLQA